jgi:hypothetical protein
MQQVLTTVEMTERWVEQLLRARAWLIEQCEHQEVTLARQTAQLSEQKAMVTRQGTQLADQEVTLARQTAQLSEQNDGDPPSYPTRSGSCRCCSLL